MTHSADSIVKDADSFQQLAEYKGTIRLPQCTKLERDRCDLPNIHAVGIDFAVDNLPGEVSVL